MPDAKTTDGAEAKPVVAVAATAAANTDTAVAELSAAAKEDLIAKIAADARSSEYEGDDDDKNEFACPWPGCSYIALRRSHLVSQIHHTQGFLLCQGSQKITFCLHLLLRRHSIG